MILQQLLELSRLCDEDEGELIEMLYRACGIYVAAVVTHRTVCMNPAQRTGDALRGAVESADRERTRCHDAVISCTDIVNRLCAAHEMAPVYTGTDARREYGDFAIALVDEIYAARYG